MSSLGGIQKVPVLYEISGVLLPVAIEKSTDVYGMAAREERSAPLDDLVPRCPIWCVPTVNTGIVSRRNSMLQKHNTHGESLGALDRNQQLIAFRGYRTQTATAFKSERSKMSSEIPSSPIWNDPRWHAEPGPCPVNVR